MINFQDDEECGRLVSIYYPDGVYPGNIINGMILVYKEMLQEVELIENERS